YCGHGACFHRVGPPVMSLSCYAPSPRLKLLAWSGYGFGHTARRQPGDLRGTVVGRQGRFRSLSHSEGGGD
ncbi:MAG TPA: hypothetical protein VEP28_06640, partial [Rubrobacter sp.]|nr:hypothetical protein [Rubrobacter sp.]